MKLWAEEGVDTSAVKRSGTAHTGLYFVTHGPDGHVFSYMRAGSAASRMTPEDVPADLIRSAKDPPCLRASARRSRRAPPMPSSLQSGSRARPA